MANRESQQHCFTADGEGEISYDAQLIVVSNVREADDGKVYVVGGDVLVACGTCCGERRGERRSGRRDSADAPSRKTDTPNAGIADHSCVTPAHETLPWGSHYVNLVRAPGHAWVAYAHSKTMPRCERLQFVPRRWRRPRNHDDSGDTGGDIPVLGAYSDGWVLAKGVEGSAAAVV